MEFSMTTEAAKRIAYLVEQEGNPDMFLRVQILGGGCSGFQYTFALESHLADDDCVFTLDGARVAVDKVSLDLLKGSQLDYVDDLATAMFVIKNPNAASKCGCGNSFSI